MAGSQRYDLIDEIPGGATQSFRARTAAGREVTVHFLRGGRTPENEALLARLRAIPPAAQANLVEVGEYEGTPFVVTAAPPYQHLAAWIKDQEPHQAAGPQKFTRVGMWKVPEFTGGTHAAPPPPPLPEPPKPAVDDFMTIFETGSTHKATPPAAPPLAPPPATGPGEFTRMFQAAPPSPEFPPAPVQAATPVPEPPAPAAPAGEFTRMFQAPPPSPSCRRRLRRYRNPLRRLRPQASLPACFRPPSRYPRRRLQPHSSRRPRRSPASSLKCFKRWSHPPWRRRPLPSPRLPLRRRHRPHLPQDLAKFTRMFMASAPPPSLQRRPGNRPANSRLPTKRRP